MQTLKNENNGVLMYEHKAIKSKRLKYIRKYLYMLKELSQTSGKKRLFNKLYWGNEGTI